METKKVISMVYQIESFAGNILIFVDFMIRDDVSDKNIYVNGYYMLDNNIEFKELNELINKLNYIKIDILKDLKKENAICNDSKN